MSIVEWIAIAIATGFIANGLYSWIRTLVTSRTKKGPTTLRIKTLDGTREVVVDPSDLESVHRFLQITHEERNRIAHFVKMRPRQSRHGEHERGYWLPEDAEVQTEGTMKPV